MPVRARWSPKNWNDWLMSRFWYFIYQALSISCSSLRCVIFKIFTSDAHQHVERVNATGKVTFLLPARFCTTKFGQFSQSELYRFWSWWPGCCGVRASLRQPPELKKLDAIIQWGGGRKVLNKWIFVAWGRHFSWIAKWAQKKQWI